MVYYDKKKRNPKCPFCKNFTTIKRGSQRSLKRYFCKTCSRSFSINHKIKPILWTTHIDGVPHRKMASLYGISHTSSYRKIEAEMDLLPENTYLSAHYCSRWSGILNLDGKHIKVRGYGKKIPFVYGIDFLTHDLPVGLLGLSENTQVFLKLFRLLKLIKYPLRIVVCDDNEAIKTALKQIYPKAKLQLCHNHYFENIRQLLQTRTDPTYRSFLLELKDAFNPKYHLLKRQAKLSHVNYKYARNNQVLLSIMADIIRREDELFAFKKINHCPATNNIIEAYNSHLNGRLKTIKGFDSFRSAERWLNAWLIRRRTKNFTDCNVPFKHLNGICSLSKTIKKDQNWPQILGLNPPKKALKMKR